MRNTFSNILLFTGLVSLLIGAYFLYQHEKPVDLSFKVSPAFQKQANNDSNAAVFLEIEKAKYIPILPARVDHNTWETTDKGVSWMKQSPIPGEKGNSILYGHNWKSILGNLSQVNVGDKVTIHYANDSKKTFTITSKSIVNPDDVHILDQSKDTRVTLYTCTGFLDTKRLAVVLQP